MANFYDDSHDLRFYVERGVDWKEVIEAVEWPASKTFATEAEATGFYQEVLNLFGSFGADDVLPKVRELDREGVRLGPDGEVVTGKAQAAIFKKMAEVGLHGLTLPRELGGMNCPMIVYFMGAELLARADASVMSHYGFHSGVAMALLVYSLQEGSTRFDPAARTIQETRFAKEIAEIARGDAWGCMDITEPDAGSDMARLRAKAECDADGQWYLTGEKIFITSGHGKYHLVIARTEPIKDPNDPMSGLKGLSMFLVPAYEDLPEGRKRVVKITRVEEKMGIHGSVTAAIQFDRAPAQLIGKRGEGFDYMLIIMNNARIGVGFEAIGICEASLRMAREYAAGRKSMGKTIDKHEMIADYLSEMQSDIEGIRAIAVEAAFHEELGFRSDVRLRYLSEGTDRVALKRSVRKHRSRARRLTPLLKYIAAEKAVEMARRCVQIHGGNGYTTEYGAERLLRDSVIMPIYEGTSQIQSLMAMKDTLGGIMKDPKGFVQRQAQARWRAVSSNDPLEREVARIQTLSMGAQNSIMMRTAARKFKDLSVAEWPSALRKEWDPKRDFALAMFHAERLTRLLTDEAICETLLEQAKRFPDRRPVLERYLERARLRARALHDEIVERDLPQSSAAPEAATA